MNDNIDILIKNVDEYVKSVISQKRYEHSVRTAQTCEKLCSIHNLDAKKGYLAGIAHDMCKEISGEQMLELAKKDKMPFSDLEMSKLSLLHGRAAAVLIREKFGVDDKNILEAIAWHTFANKNLCDLGKLLFVSDKIEPGRPQSTDEYRANLYSLTIDELTLSVLNENCEYLQAHGKSVAPFSLMLREELLKNKNIKGGKN